MAITSAFWTPPTRLHVMPSPLFFLAVKTNVDHQVEGSFVIEDETVSSINEALGVLKKWNPNWSPPLFMTDNSLQEIQAIEKVFPGKFDQITPTLVKNRFTRGGFI